MSARMSYWMSVLCFALAIVVMTIVPSAYAQSSTLNCATGYKSQDGPKQCPSNTGCTSSDSCELDPDGTGGHAPYTWCGCVL